MRVGVCHFALKLRSKNQHLLSLLLFVVSWAVLCHPSSIYFYYFWRLRGWHSPNKKCYRHSKWGPKPKAILAAANNDPISGDSLCICRYRKMWSLVCYFFVSVLDEADSETSNWLNSCLLLEKDVRQPESSNEPQDCRFTNRMLKNVNREWSKCQEVLRVIIGLIGTELCRRS